MALLRHCLPRDDGFYMPAEWAPHQQTWMLWPHRPDNWRLGAKPAQKAFVQVAQAIAAFEPVTVGVMGRQFEYASMQLEHPNIRVVELSSDDAWVRDTGPTFVINTQGQLRGIDWGFNAWGGMQSGLYFPWDKDEKVAAKILGIERCDRYETVDFILEGGAIHVDGEGTLLTTEECLLNPNRNPHMDRTAIETRLAEMLNIERIIWLPYGLHNDETDGHIDNFCCFIEPAHVLLAWTDDPQDPNYTRCRAAEDRLTAVQDARGRQIIITHMPLPGPIHATLEECESVETLQRSQKRDPSIRLAGSYINFLMVNGGVVAPAFGDEQDAVAREILQQCFPDRKIVMVPGREILLGGGNIHCITQQQPAA
ncbi:agmatine deiminase [Terasakiispira papahanaumokuakeensis]|uniref:Putative agmatine deiminase n=1 Tax=Terasakiispira papahanaumokuakeensis TaxID=197479 RepID=A0A1E2V9Z1_9GAMM|nr:agmatine deiminase [Terasakiispira papahanaumokuakeensis]ODC03794.1 agmatine deiminase [Terasakiispira papahanaumokuakeensis]